MFFTWRFRANGEGLCPCLILSNGAKVSKQICSFSLKIKAEPAFPARPAQKDDNDLQILDVCSDGEWKRGYVPNAEHIYVAHLAENIEKLDKSKTVATYCGSGYRASIAAKWRYFSRD